MCVTILIVEDDEMAQGLFVTILKNTDYVIKVVDTCDEAIKLIRKNSYDVILTDVETPGKYNGVDLVEEVMENDPSQKIIVMTGNGMHCDQVKVLSNARMYGAVHAMLKPLHNQELKDIVKRYAYG